MAYTARGCCATPLREAPLVLQQAKRLNKGHSALVFGAFVLGACAGPRTPAPNAEIPTPPPPAEFTAGENPAGIRLLPPQADGQYTPATEDNLAAVRTVGYSGPQQYLTSWLYFATDQGLQSSEKAPVTIQVEYFDQGVGPIVLQYDSTESVPRYAPLFDPAYMPVTLVYRQNTGQWRTVSQTLTDARFGHRQSGGADFRLAAYHGELILRRVTISRPGQPASMPLVRPRPSPPAPYPSPLGARAAFTYFFYWYDSVTGMHMSPFTDTPPDFRTITFRDVNWQKRQLEDMAYAGIDVLLPVYWYNQASLTWSRPGIKVLAQALEVVRDEGITPPSVGVFMDTTSSKGKDLRQESEKAYVYESIHYFFSTIPRPYWALTQDGRPIIFFYQSNWPSGYNQSFIDYLYDHFRQDFGIRPYLVFEASWTYPMHTVEGGGRKVTYSGDGRLRYDASYHWGGAFRARTTDQVTSVGPGYGPVWSPGRQGPTYSARLNGQRYRDELLQAIVCPAPWVGIETWNEFHEAADIAESLQWGRQYIEITRELLPYFKAGQPPPGTPASSQKCTAD
jgi:hypothetical protein